MININDIQNKLKKLKTFALNNGGDVDTYVHESKEDKKYKLHCFNIFCDKFYSLIFNTENDYIDFIAIDYYHPDDENLTNPFNVYFREKKEFKITELDIDYAINLTKQLIKVDETIELYHEHSCPICGKQLIGILGRNEEANCCPNECYTHMNGYDLDARKMYDYFIIFDTRVHFYEDVSNLKKKRLKNYIRKNIHYWKENDRYLTNIVTRTIHNNP